MGSSRRKNKDKYMVFMDGIQIPMNNHEKEEKRRENKWRKEHTNDNIYASMLKNTQCFVLLKSNSPSSTMSIIYHILGNFLVLTLARTPN